MSLEYIVHRPGSPADRLIDEKVAEVMRDPLAQICVITPARSTYQTQERLVRASGRGGHLGLQVISPARLAHEVVSGSFGASMDTLPEFEKAALVRRIIRENAEQLPVFGQYETIDFATLVADTLDNLRAQGVEAHNVRKYADAADSTHAADLARTWEEYEKERAGRMDDWERMETAIAHLADSHLFNDTALVVVHGFDAYGEQEKRLLQEVLRTAPRVLLSIYGSDDPADSRIFADAERAGQELCAWAEKMGIPVQRLTAPSEDTVPADIAHAARYAFSPYAAGKWTGLVPSISVHRASSKEEEVRAVAEEIARLHLEEDVPFEQLAVVYGEDNEYAEIVERVFTEANVPHFASRLVDPAATGIGAAMLAAADLVYGPATIDDLMVYYAGTFRNAGYAATRRAQLERAIKDSDLLDDILGNGDLPEETRSRIRSEIEEDFGGLRNEYRGKEAVDGAVIFHALSRLLKRKWKSTADQVAKSAEDPELFSSIELNWVQGFSVLDRLAEQLAREPVRPGQARELLAAALHSSQFVTVPKGADEVQVGRLGAIEVPNVHTLFLIGMNDEVLPKFAESSGGVLSSAEYSGIVKDTTGEEPRTKEAQQKFALVHAMRRVGTHLWCSYDTSGGLKPSIVIDRLLNRLFADRLKEQSIDSARFRLLQNACSTALHTMDDADDLPEILQEPEFSKRFAMAKAAHQGIVQPNMVPDSAPEPSSASALTLYNKCAYRYYLSKGLRAEEAQDSKDALHDGNYMHNVMQLLGEKIQKHAGGSVKWSDISDEDFEQILEEAIHEAAAKDEHSQIYENAAAALAIVQEQLRRAAWAIRDVRKDGLFAPEAFEVEFTAEDGTYSGRIDRIDMAEYGDEKYYYVIDYKSSNKDYGHASLAAGTESIQLIFYAMALADLIREKKLDEGKLAGAGFVRARADLQGKPDNAVSMGLATGFVSVEDVAASLFHTTKTGGTTRLDGLAKTRTSGDPPNRIHGTDAKNRGLPVGEQIPGAALTLKTAEQHVRRMLRKAAESIRNGNVHIQPLHLSSNDDHEELLEAMRMNDSSPDGCKYCGYDAVCRFDPAQSEVQIRVSLSHGEKAGRRLQEQNAQWEDEADAGE